VVFWHSEQPDGESDARVLRAQLALAAQSARATRLTTPVWAIIVAVLCSTGAFGHVSWARSLFLPLAVGVAVGAGALMASA
jgi:two-component system cell cycle sensor histidine kinase PleC